MTYNYCFTQNNKEEIARNFPAIYSSFGLGIDYGGIGTKLEFFPIKYVGVLAGGGYNLDQLAYNVGVRVNPISNENIGIYLSTLYGYNAVVLAPIIPKYYKTSYGFSFGGGVEIYFKRERSLQLNFYFPNVSSDFKNHVKTISEDPFYDVIEPRIAVWLSIGFKIKI